MDCLKSKSNLKSYQHLAIGQWVQNGKAVIGEITGIEKTSEGKIRVWVLWSGDRTPILEQPDRLTPIESRSSPWTWTNDFRLLGKPDNRECDDIDYLSQYLQILIELKHKLEEDRNEAITIVEKNQTNDYQRDIQEKERQIEYIRDRLQLLSCSSPRFSIAIDPEFKVLIPPLSREEKAQLEANLREQGCRDALVVWKGHNLLIDGHNRYEICLQHGIEFQTREIDLPSREAVRDWIIDNQLGRRNLTPEMVSYLRGKQYNAMKHSHGGNRRAKAQNEPLLNRHLQKRI
jgi:hypothetical protein